MAEREEPTLAEGGSSVAGAAEAEDAVAANTEEEAVAAARSNANAGTTPGDVAGLGVDIVEIERMRIALERTPRFRDRLFSEQERAYCEEKARPEIHYALFFAAKEAVLKALGTGFSGMKVTDVEVGHDRFGRPVSILHDNAREVAEAQGILNIYLSLSYTHTVGVASAVAAKEEHRPHKDEKVDPKAELAAQFRELRALLDEVDGKLTQIEQENGETLTEPEMSAVQTADEADDILEDTSTMSEEDE
jgi:holo-[acyl-carrier protein] synthase